MDRSVGSVALEAIEVRTVRAAEPGTEFPALIVLGDFEDQQIPADMESDIDFVGTGLDWPGDIERVDLLIVEPNFQPVIAPQFQPRGLVEATVDPGARVGHALLAAERFGQVQEPGALRVGASSQWPPIRCASFRVFWGKCDVK